MLNCYTLFTYFLLYLRFRCHFPDEDELAIATPPDPEENLCRIFMGRMSFRSPSLKSNVQAV